MRKVFKYQIPINDYVDIALPEDAQILTVDCQHGQPCLWALVDPTAPEVTRRFRFAGTGHPITDDTERLFFHGTFQMDGGSLIFHIFEVVNYPICFFKKPT